MIKIKVNLAVLKGLIIITLIKRINKFFSIILIKIIRRISNIKSKERLK